jgi:UPF0755 protein
MFRKLLLAGLILLALGAAGLGYVLLAPYKGFEKEVFVVIEPGTTSRAMAERLEHAGVIRSSAHFLVARALQPGATLQAGEYRFERPYSALEAFQKIARGDVFYHVVTVPEGSNIFDIAAELERIGLMKSAEFLKVARDASLIRDIAPEAPSLEGYLFPSTYRLTRQTTPRQLAREMTAQFRKIWQQLNGPATGVNRMVTLASLVEKETAVPEERKAVASVYHNRLRLGMKLDCDPTTIYAALLEGRYRGTIYKSDLENPHPYNTYRNPGLPPGPIANPGRDSLEAALRPADTPYLFFVAKRGGGGAHVFSQTLAEHNAAVQQYRNAAP